jgi:adenylate cyclase
MFTGFSRLRGMAVIAYTFLFADLCGYTEYTWRHGDDRSAELAVGFNELVARLATEESCKVVKSIGDGVMVHADRCINAVQLARRIHRGSARLGYPPIRVGIDTGSAVSRNGDWYGNTVNTAARVAEAADPGELLMTTRAVAAASKSAAIETVERGCQALKGLPDCSLHAALVSA